MFNSLSVSATCQQAGTTAGTKCATCDKIMSGVEAISQKEHSYTGECVEKGTGHAFQCVNGCEGYGPMRAHTGEWKVAEEPTCTMNGSKVFECTACDYTATQTIPAPGPGGTEIEDPDVPLGGDPDDGDADDGAVLIDEPEVPLADLMTRAEFVNYLYVQAGSPDAQASTFADVAEDHEYAAAIGWAQSNGIAKGITEDEFAPDEIVSVDQAHLFLVRYAQFMGVDMPELAALAGKDPLEILDNADEVLAEFFAAISPKEQAA